jgi:hypothetical protein
VSRSIARSNHGLSHRPSVTHDDDMITKKARMVRESINHSMRETGHIAIRGIAGALVYVSLYYPGR